MLDDEMLTDDELDNAYYTEDTNHEEGLRRVAAAVLRALPAGVYTTMSLHALAQRYEEGPVTETDVAEDRE